MKLDSYINVSKYLTLCFLFAVLFPTLYVATRRNYKNSTSVVDKDFLKHINLIKNKMIKEGSEFKNVGLKFISKTNRYVIAEEDIKKNSTIIKIPFKNLLSVKNPLIEKFCKSLNVDEFSSTEKIFENQYECLIVFIFGQLRNPDPSIKSYIETIPKNFLEYPQFFMEPELPKLNNSFMANWYKYEMSRSEAVSGIIKRANSKDFNNKNFTLADVKHAYIALASRNFGIKLKNENKYYNVLAPYTDMFNFNPNSNTEWIEELNDENGFFTLRALQDIKKGKEIFVCYGSDDNEKLLFDYGFTLEKNPSLPSNSYFIYTHQGKNSYGSLKMNEMTGLIDMVKFHRPKKNLKNKFTHKSDKEKIKKKDLEVFKSVLESLKKYSNKERIEEYAKKGKQNANYMNISRALRSEDALIDKNVKYLGEIIEILEGGPEKLKEKKKSEVVKQNLKYFEELLL